MEESTLRWPTDKEREEMEEVCSIGSIVTLTFAQGQQNLIDRSLDYVNHSIKFHKDVISSF